MTSSGENIFRVAGPLWGRFTGHRWIPLTKWRSFDVFFDLRLKKRLSKQTRRRWFETHRANYDVTDCNWYSFTVRVWSTIYLQIHDCYCCRFFRMPSGNLLIVDGREENMPILHSPHNIFFSCHCGHMIGSRFGNRCSAVRTLLFISLWPSNRIQNVDFVFSFLNKRV